jgi:hypothetical protein
VTHDRATILEGHHGAINTYKVLSYKLAQDGLDASLMRRERHRKMGKTQNAKLYGGRGDTGIN